MARARVLVHGATGFTGGLVCKALARRGIPFAIGGRDAAKLERVAASLAAVGAGITEVAVIDLASPDTLRAAIEGRALVCACAGPFAQVGEAMLASCARAGVSYVDTTGEQSFVADAVARYRATAEASGACVVPAMAYEMAPADWAADLAAKQLGEAPDEIAIAYIMVGEGGRAFAPTRGTKKSALGVLAEDAARQLVDGALVRERPAAHLRKFASPRLAREIMTVSFPSPEAILVASHTGARTVRTYMTQGPVVARLAHATRGVTPFFARLARGLVERTIDRGAEGPDDATRASARFEIICEASKGSRRATVVASGHDPYGLTAELQAYAAERALAGELRAKGVVAPSVAFPSAHALEELAQFSLRIA